MVRAIKSQILSSLKKKEDKMPWYWIVLISIVSFIVIVILFFRFVRWMGRGL